MSKMLGCIMFKSKLQEIQAKEFGITCNIDAFKQDTLRTSREHYLENYNTCNIKFKNSCLNFDDLQYNCTEETQCTTTVILDCTDRAIIIEEVICEKPIITQL